MKKLFIIFMFALNFNINASNADGGLKCCTYKDWVVKYQKDPITEDSFGFCSSYKGQVLNEVPFGFSTGELDKKASKATSKKARRKVRLVNMAALTFLCFSVG